MERALNSRVDLRPSVDPHSETTPITTVHLAMLVCGSVAAGRGARRGGV